MTIEIRQLGPDDVGVLARAAEDVFDGPVVAEWAAAYLADPTHLMLVALDGDLVVGQAAAMINRHPDGPSDLFIDNLGVASTYHRRGVARQLIKAMFALGRRLDCKQAWVATETDNVPARRLYESLGDAGGTFVMFEYDLGAEAD